jgi:Kef-type K+ transport system membrane component KefB
MNEIFFNVSIMLIAGTIAATIAKALKQPMIPAYILSGVIIGPPVLGLFHNDEMLHTLSTFGIAFLLFLVGIELDLRVFRKVGKVAVIVCLIQMTAAVGIGYVFIRFLDFDVVTSLFIALALAFSSTILGVKMMAERKELDTLYGQLVIGILLTQDILAMLTLIFIPLLLAGNLQGSDAFGAVAAIIGKAIALTVFAVAVSQFILRYLFRFFAHTSELLFLGSICWCLFVSMLSILLGFSVEVGALIAGVSLSFIPYSIEIGNRISSLRDFFLPLFFATLGGQLLFDSFVEYIIPTIVMVLIVLFVTPIVVTCTWLIFGYRTRTSFMAGMALGQISEFSFVLMAVGFTNGAISRDVIALIALVGLISMTVSTYMMEYSDTLYTKFRPLLKKFERKKYANSLENISQEMKNHVVIFGFHTMGQRIARLITDVNDQSLLIIDHNPDVIRALTSTSYNYLYGTMSDHELLQHAHLSEADSIISTVPDRRSNLALLNYVHDNKIKATVIVTAFHVNEALEYYELGAHFVIYPTLIAVDAVADVLQNRHHAQRKTHIKELRNILKESHAL